jgi:hypothetical protein
MSELIELKTKLAGQEEFIRNILTELGEVYDLVGGLKEQAEKLKTDFQLLLKETANDK